MSARTFSSLELNKALLDNLDSLGYLQMTPIQAASLPLILAGKDLIAQGKTGSGKTAAFGLGLLEKLEFKRFRVQSLVICPTRELADQVANEIRALARAIQNIKVTTLCGGMPFGPQIGSLERGSHIVVATPGRLDEHLRKGTLRVNEVKTLVLDEADRMLEMGFQEVLDQIIAALPTRRQTLLFSATYPSGIEAIAKRVMKSPEMVQAQALHDAGTIQQRLFRVNNEKHRLEALRLLLLEKKANSAIVFCNTKRDTQTVAAALIDFGFSALALHGDLDQKERTQVLTRFDNKSINVLVATDVAARGLDIEAIDIVVNFQIARDEEVHTHRIGRTGRAGSKGVACTLFCENESYKVLNSCGLDPLQDLEPLPPITLLSRVPVQSAMTTLQIDGGKKQKLRAGDILGALTAKGGVEGKQVGKINIQDNCAYVAVERAVYKKALNIIGKGTMKGRTFRIRFIG